MLTTLPNVYTGVQTRNVSCAKTSDFEMVSDDLCDPQLKPPVNKTCATEACEPRFVDFCLSVTIRWIHLLIFCPVGLSESGLNAQATAKQESSSVQSTANKSLPVQCSQSLMIPFVSKPLDPNQCPLKSATKKLFVRNSTWESGDR